MLITNINLNYINGIKNQEILLVNLQHKQKNYDYDKQRNQIGTGKGGTYKV